MKKKITHFHSFMEENHPMLNIYAQTEKSKTFKHHCKSTLLVLKHILYLASGRTNESEMEKYFMLSHQFFLYADV